MLQGMAAEMGTGEGKTLMATLPACTAAMAGIPTYTSLRSTTTWRGVTAKMMSPLYNVLGMSVGAITEDLDDPTGGGKPFTPATSSYCTNQAVAFDYLRDRVTMGYRRGRVHRSIDRLRAGAVELRPVAA